MLRLLAISALTLSIVACKEQKKENVKEEKTSVILVDDLSFENRLPVLNTETNILDDEGVIEWGGSVIKGEDGKYHMFYAKWAAGCKDRIPEDVEKHRFCDFGGWLKYSEIAHAVSDNPNGPFKYTNTILKGTHKKGDWDEFTAHNPHIKKFGNKYYLYYIGTSQKEGFQSNFKSYIAGQRIGVIVVDKLEDLISGNFTRSTKPLVVPNGEETHNRTVNPSVTQGADGQFYMMFKSYTEPSGKGGHMTHWIAKAATPDGDFKVAGNVFNTHEYAAEDPFFWFDKKRNRYYAIVKNWAQAGGPLGEQMGCLSLITSETGVDGWKPATHSLVSNREFTNEKGELVKLNNLERPQLLLDDEGQPICLYTACLYELPGKVGFYKGGKTANLHFLLK